MDPIRNTAIQNAIKRKHRHIQQDSHIRFDRPTDAIADGRKVSRMRVRRLTPEQHHQVIDMFVRDGHVLLEAQGFYPGISPTPRNDPTNLEGSRDADRSIHTRCTMYSELSHRADDPKLNTRTKSSQKAFLPKQPEHIPQTR